MAAALTRVAGVHQALWNYDSWYRYAWFVWPQALSLLVATLVFSSQEPAGPRPVAAQWVKPVAAAAPPPPPEEVALCNNHQADAKLRGEACDRLIKSGKLAGLQLAGAYYGRAWMHQLTNQYDGAINDYSESLKLNPSNYFALNGRGWMYINKNELDKAYADFTKSIEINKSSINALAFANRAEVLRKQGKLSEAQTDLNEALRLNDKLQMAILVRDSLQADLKRVAEEKKNPPTQGSPPGPSSAPSTTAHDASAIRARGATALQQGKWGDAINAFSTLIQAGSANPADFDSRGMAYASKQPPDTDAAMADYTRAIALTGHDWRPHARRAVLFVQRNQLREALNDANAAINDHKGNEAAVFILRGRIYLAQANTDEAWQDFNKATELAPESADAYMLRGLASADASRRGLDACRRQTEKQRNLVGGPCSRPIDFLDAQMDFRTALAKNPKLAQAHFELGRVMQDLNRHQDAVDAYTEAIRINPAYAAAYNNRGVAYNNLKKPEPAFFDYSEAIRHDPRLAVAWANRGDLYANAGQRNDAIGDYRKALSLDEKNQRAIDGLRRLGAR